MVAWYWFGIMAALGSFAFVYIGASGMQANLSIDMVAAGVPQAEADWHNALWSALPIFVVLFGLFYGISEAQKRGVFG